MKALDLDTVPWADVATVRRPEEGSGVVFVSFATHAGWLVVKGSMNVVPETFATLITRAAGLHVPRVRLVSCADAGDEWERLKYHVAAGCGADEALKRHTSHLLDRPVLFLMHYEEDAVPLWHPTVRWGDPGLLRSLGTMVAVDVVLNNVDRLACGSVWANPGNLGNVLVRSVATRISDDEYLEEQEAVPIDCLYVPRMKPELHMEKLAAFAYDPEGHAAAVLQTLHQTHGLPVYVGERTEDILSAPSRDQVHHLACGMAVGLERAQRMFLPGGAADTLTQYLRKRVPPQQDWEMLWRKGCTQAFEHPYYATVRDALLALHPSGERNTVPLQPFEADLAILTQHLPCEWHALPHHASTPLRVALVQLHATPEAAAAAARDYFAAYRRPVNLISFSENAFGAGNCDAVARMVRLACQLDAHICIGSSPRGNGENASFTCCPDGTVTVPYVKRANNAALPGDAAVHFDLALGVRAGGVPAVDGAATRASTCICLDVEVPEILADAFDGGTRVILNPSFIPGFVGPGAPSPAWRSAMYFVAHKFAHLFVAQRAFLLKCDSTGATGVSQVVTPYAAIQTLPKPRAKYVFADLLDANMPDVHRVARLRLGGEVAIRRSMPHDDVGNRFVVRALPEAAAWRGAPAPAHLHLLVARTAASATLFCGKRLAAVKELPVGADAPGWIPAAGHEVLLLIPTMGSRRGVRMYNAASGAPLGTVDIAPLGDGDVEVTHAAIDTANTLWLAQRDAGGQVSIAACPLPSDGTPHAAAARVAGEVVDRVEHMAVGGGDAVWVAGSKDGHLCVALLGGLGPKGEALCGSVLGWQPLRASCLSPAGDAAAFCACLVTGALHRIDGGGPVLTTAAYGTFKRCGISGVAAVSATQVLVLDGVHRLHVYDARGAGCVAHTVHSFPFGRPVPPGAEDADRPVLVSNRSFHPDAGKQFPLLYVLAGAASCVIECSQGNSPQTLEGIFVGPPTCSA